MIVEGQMSAWEVVCGPCVATSWRTPYRVECGPGDQEVEEMSSAMMAAGHTPVVGRFVRRGFYGKIVTRTERNLG